MWSLSPKERKREEVLTSNRSNAKEIPVSLTGRCLQKSVDHKKTIPVITAVLLPVSYHFLPSLGLKNPPSSLKTGIWEGREIHGEYHRWIWSILKHPAKKRTIHICVYIHIFRRNFPWTKHFPVFLQIYGWIKCEEGMKMFCGPPFEGGCKLSSYNIQEYIHAPMLQATFQLSAVYRIDTLFFTKLFYSKLI